MKKYNWKPVDLEINGQVRDQTWYQIREQLWYRVNDQVRRPVRRQIWGLIKEKIDEKI